MKPVNVTGVLSSLILALSSICASASQETALFFAMPQALGNQQQEVPQSVSIPKDAILSTTSIRFTVPIGTLQTTQPPQEGAWHNNAPSYRVNCVNSARYDGRSCYCPMHKSLDKILEMYDGKITSTVWSCKE